MRVLFVTPYIPNVLRTRPYYLLKTLAERHDITLVAPYFNQEELEDSHSLKQEIPQLHLEVVALSKRQAIFRSLLALPKRQPMQAAYCYSPELVARCRDLITQSQAHSQNPDRPPFDLVHIEHFRAGFMGKELASLGVPVVFDSVDCISLLVERTLKHGPLKNRLVSLIELGPTRRYEARLLRSGNFSAYCATSQEDAGALEELALSMDRPRTGQPVQSEAMSVKVQVIPNGVDLAYFSPPPADQPRKPDTVVFSGKMSYHANGAAARYLVHEIWPLVRETMPQAKLILAGNRPPADLVKLSGHNGIEVTGYVADMRRYLCSATVAVAPMVYSVGIQNKVLEAMACATPVVATGDINRAVTAQDGQDLYLVPPAHPQQFARRVIELLQNPAKAAEMGNQGRSKVVNDYSWQKAAHLIEEWWHQAQKPVQPVGAYQNGRDNKV